MEGQRKGVQFVAGKLGCRGIVLSDATEGQPISYHLPSCRRRKKTSNSTRFGRKVFGQSRPMLGAPDLARRILREHLVQTAGGGLIGEQAFLA